MKNLALFLVAALFVAGCKKEVEFNTAPAVTPTASYKDSITFANSSKKYREMQITDRIQQKAYSEGFDFLWVIDTSESMADIRELLSQKLGDLLNILSARRKLAEVNMAVTSTDVSLRRGLFWTNSGDILRMNFQQKSSNVFPIWASKWNELVGQVGASGKTSKTRGWEQGLEAGYQAIESAGGRLARPGRPFVVAYVTDEQDYSCYPNCPKPMVGLAQDYQNETFHPISRYVNQLKKLEQRIQSDVLVYPVVHLSDPTCDPAGTTNTPSVGSRYMEVQRAMNKGQSFSICRSELEKSLDQIAEVTADTGVCFGLKRKGLVPHMPISVKVNGVEVPRAAQDGFDSPSGEEKVCFSGVAIPRNGDWIEITYTIREEVLQ